MTNKWIEEFEEKYRQSVYDAFPEYKVACKILLDDIMATITTLLEKQNEKYVEKIKNTQDKYKGIDKRTKEKTYSGNKVCRDCGRRKDNLEIDEIINLIKSHDKTS